LKHKKWITSCKKRKKSNAAKHVIPSRKGRWGQVIRRKIYGSFKKEVVVTGHQTEDLWSLQERGGDRSSDGKSMVRSRNRWW
jgi:hypothetical protein